jgi:hypothetical protein
MITTPATANADGVLARLVRTIVAQAGATIAGGATAYVDRADTVYGIPTTTTAQGAYACIRRTDMPAAPAVLVAFDLDIYAVNSTQRIEAV